jgi:hypothetical protein
MNEINIAAVIMVCNEEKRISTTLESLKKNVKGIIVFDTGSEDNTIKIIKNFSKKEKISFHLLEGVFEDFAKSRNKLLDFANKIAFEKNYHYFLLLDSNDEFQNRLKLNKILEKELLKTSEKNIDSPDAFIIHQKWFVGTENYIDYFNIRIIKSNKNFKYEGSVHEYIVQPPNSNVVKLKDSVILYQDRIADNDGKTRLRWENDKKILLKELELNPNDARYQYYLAQTFECLGDVENAFHYFKIRSLNENGFFEEKFISLMKCGMYSKDEKDLNVTSWYFKAFEIIQRAEPLIELSKIFRLRNQFLISYCFSKLACELKFPDNCLLWVDRKAYSHDRWQELSISAYYVKKFEEGRVACEKAIKSGFDIDLNNNNLKWYLEQKTIKND